MISSTSQSPHFRKWFLEILTRIDFFNSIAISVFEIGLIWVILNHFDQRSVFWRARKHNIEIWIVLTTSLQRLNIVFSLSGPFDLSISENSEVWAKSAWFGDIFGIFDEILSKFIPLIFQSSLEEKEKVQTLTISTVSTFCHRWTLQEDDC